MDFRTITVKDFMDNAECKKVIEELAPQMLKYPIKLFSKKKMGDIFDLCTSKNLVPMDVAVVIEERCNEILK